MVYSIIWCTIFIYREVLAVDNTVKTEIEKLERYQDPVAEEECAYKFSGVSVIFNVTDALGTKSKEKNRKKNWHENSE